MGLCPTSLRGIAMRWTLQDSCNVPLDTPNRIMASNGFVSIELTPDVEDGSDITIKLADGTICVHDTDDDQIKGWEIVVKMCNLDPYFMQCLTGGQTLLDGDGDAKGGWFPGIERMRGTHSKQLEIWAKNGTKGACSTLIDDDPNFKPSSAYVRWILPSTRNWTISDGFTFDESGEQMLSYSGYAESNPLFVPALGIDPASGPTSNNPAADPPAGTAYDPDLSYANVLAARKGGALGWVCSDTLPEMAPCGEFVV